MTEENNTSSNDTGARFVLRQEPKVATFADGINWFVEGTRLFVKSPFIWIFLFLAWAIINLFSVLLLREMSKILWPIFLAGFMWGAYSLDKKSVLPIDCLFAGFTKNAKSLLILGLYYFAAFVLIYFLSMWVTELLVGEINLAEYQKNVLALYTGQADPAHVEKMVITMRPILFLSLLLLGFSLPLFMAIWFAPALIILNNLQPFQAAKMSFVGCLRNMFSFLSYGLVAFGAMIIAFIPLGIGFILVMPIIFASIYISYKDIFIDETAGPTDHGQKKDNNKIGIEV